MDEKPERHLKNIDYLLRSKSLRKITLASHVDFHGIDAFKKLTREYNSIVRLMEKRKSKIQDDKKQLKEHMQKIPPTRRIGYMKPMDQSNLRPRYKGLK